MPGRTPDMNPRPGRPEGGHRAARTSVVLAPGRARAAFPYSVFPGPAGRILLVMLALVGAACGKDATGPAQRPVAIAAVDGNAQFGLARATLELLLTVQLTDAGTGAPVKDIAVSWRVTSGPGASVTATKAATDEIGLASAQLTLGPAAGPYRVEATAPMLVGGPASFEANAIPQPSVQSIAPLVAAAGSTVVITGSNFHPVPGNNTVLFDGWRGTVTAAAPERLDVTVPRCVLTRDVNVTVAIGAVRTSSLRLRTVAAAVPVVTLARGQARVFTDPDDFDCLVFDGVPAGAEYLIVVQNAAQRVGFPVRFELNAITGAGAPATFAAARQPPVRREASDWELLLRRREQSLGRPGAAGASAASSGAGVTGPPPRVGDRRTFNVLKRDLTSRSITAEVRVVSQRAALYVDLQAPASGFTDADLVRLGAMFDDPIYATDVDVFGAPSDIDANGVVLMVFTPAVNELTERSASGFIAGYFYGCDLVAASRCKDTNSGEIVYSMVPDPSGQFSASRSKDTVLRTVPGVLAHEFQHMIHFGRRGGSLDVLWVAEGLAHAAEDIVGDVFLARGDAVTANDFRRPNHVRTQFFLGQTAATPLISEEAPGSLELRGAAWLFVKYLTGHYGGTDLLGRLTAMTGKGVPNITTATGQPWPSLLGAFAIAIWADDAPELAGVTIDSGYRFTNLDVRATLANVSGGYSLRPATLAWGDFQWSGTVASAGEEYTLIRVPAAAPPPFRLALTGLRGGRFDAATPVQLTVLRIR